MTVRFYSSQDTGAPALINTGGTLLGNLRLVLKACLVDGYGAKPAAGWALGHDVTDGFSVVSSGGVMCFSTVSTQTVEMTIMETITDGSTAIPAGYNRRSGRWYDGSAEASRQRMYCIGFTTYTDKRWYVVADDKTVVFYIAGGTTTIDANYAYSAAIYFGAFRAPLGVDGFCCLGGYVSTGPSGPSVMFKENSGVMLRQPFTGLVDQGIAAQMWGSLAAHGGSTQASARGVVQPIDLRPARAGIVGMGAGISGTTQTSTYVYCGRLRGIISEPSLSFSFLTDVLKALGKPSPTYLDVITPITLENGSVWVPLFPNTNDMCAFVSLDASEWD